MKGIVLTARGIKDAETAIAPTHELVEVTDTLVRKIKPSPWQRPLHEGRVQKLSDRLAPNSIVPPVLLARIGGDIFTVDGQHRLAAWAIKPFVLFAQIATLPTHDRAAADFVDLNTSAVRVNRSHIVRVDPRPFPKKIRALQTEFDVSASQVLSLLEGIINHNGYNTLAERCQDKDFATAKTILKFWVADKRFRDEASFWGQVGCLKMAAHLCRDKKSPEKILKAMALMDFSRSGAVAKRYGTSGMAVKTMLDYARKFVLNKIS